MTSTNALDLAAIIEPHIAGGISGGYYRCECSHTYEAVIRSPEGHPDAEQAQVIHARHAQHIAEQLIAAGVELPAPDPRQAMRDRIAARRKVADAPQA